MKNRSGFTLAEVLITLGIIGVVAAMTIPTLMTNTTASQFKTGFKKSLSSLKQGITMNVAMDDFDLRDLSKTANNAKSFKSIISKRFEGATEVAALYFDAKNANDGTGEIVVIGDHVCTEKDFTEWANVKDGDDEAKKGVFPCVKPEGDSDEEVIIKGAGIAYPLNKTNFAVYQMADGSIFGYYKNAEKCTTNVQEGCVGFIDTNGVAGPNRVTVCDNEKYDSKTSCVVSNDKVADIFPIRFYNQTVEPGSVAAKSILMGFKVNK